MGAFSGINKYASGLKEIQTYLRDCNIGTLSTITNFETFEKTLAGMVKSGLMPKKGLMGIRDIEEIGNAYDLTGESLKKIDGSRWVQSLEEQGYSTETAYQMLDEYKTRLKWVNVGLRQNYKHMAPIAKMTAKWRMSSLQLLGTMFGIKSVSKIWNDAISTMFSSTSDYSYALMDLADAWNEVGYAIEVQAGAIIDWQAGIVESFANWVNTWPDWAKSIAAGFVVIGGQLVGLASIAADSTVAAFGIASGFSWLRETSALFDKTITYFGSLAKGAKDFLPWIKQDISSVGSFKDAISGMASSVIPALTSMTKNWKTLTLGIAGFAIGLGAGLLIAQKLKGIFGPIGAALVSLAGILMIGVAAWIGYHTAMSGPFAPIVGPMILTGVGVAIAGALALSNLFDTAIPPAQKGGLVEQTGLAKIHAGEQIIPKDFNLMPQIEPVMIEPIATPMMTNMITQNIEAPRPESSLIKPIQKEEQVPTSITIQIYAPIGSKEIADYVCDEVTRKIESKLKRTR